MSILPSLSPGLGVDASAPPQPKGAILLVEDETTIVMYLSVLLKREGFEVICAGDGKTGIELFAGSSQRVVMAIVDGRLPDMSGEKVCCELRSIVRKLPVLFCSGLMTTGTVETLGERTRFLAKPFTPSQILNDIRGLLSQSGVAI